MAHTVFFPLVGDFWLDNGLEVLYRALEEVRRQKPKAVNSLSLLPDGVEVEVDNFEELMEGLEGVIKNWMQERLYYWTESKGERRRALKQFVTFNRQPPSQHPKVFLQGKRRALLEAAFSSDVKGKRNVCPLCGIELTLTEDLTQSVHPLAGKVKSLAGVRVVKAEGALVGFVERFKICPRCYLRGAMVWLDDGLIYRTGGRDRPSFVILPAPAGYTMLRLHEIKEGYRKSLRLQDGMSNVKVVVRRASGESEERPPAGNSLLLAFLERLLADILAEVGIEDFWGEVRRRVSEEWAMFTIPFGAMKNVTARNVVLDEPVVELLRRCVEGNLLPYRDVVAQIWVVDERTRRALAGETDEFREEMSRAILGDDFGSFASLLVPRPRRSPAITAEVEGRLEKFVREWRCGRMDAERLEVAKKAGRALGQIAMGPEGRGRGAPTLLYALERARSAKDMLDVLAQACHKVMGFEPDELKYLSLEGLEKLTDIVHQIGGGELDELRNTLLIYAVLEWARRARREAATEGEGS